MKLYLSTRSPNPRRVQFFLAEKGIAVPEVFVDLVKNEHLEEGFLRLNPLRRLPVLELDDGTIITESIAICRYFEAIHPEPNLFGATPVEQALVEMWQRQVELNFLLPVQYAFRHVHPGMAGREVPQVKEWGEANKPKVLDFLTYLDAELARRAFVALDRFTVADITALITLEFMKVARIAQPEELANLARWRAAVSARPAAKVGA